MNPIPNLAIMASAGTGKTFSLAMRYLSLLKLGVEPDEIVRRGKLDFSTNKNGLRYARVILEKYNNQRKNAKKLPYRFAD